MSCPHLPQLSLIYEPPSQLINGECTQCFDKQDLPQGVDVCLSCFNGGCVNDDPERQHARLHHQKLGHPFSLNIKRKLESSKERFSIVTGCEEDKYDYEITLRCWLCAREGGSLLSEVSDTTDVKRLAAAVVPTASSARQSEVKRYKEDLIDCNHTRTLQQWKTVAIPSSGLAHCLKCDLENNLWLCLTCGIVGCGRRQYGIAIGNGHGLKHYMDTRHPVSVKLCTITPEGGADIYCYQCDDYKLDPELSVHLSSFGISIATQTKTEKSHTELQNELNFNYVHSIMPVEDGKALEPLFGPGLTGLSNLGNSCYMASTLQTIFTLPAFRERYLASFSDHARTCSEPLPAACIDCQMRKIADGLLSGRYSVPRSHVPGSPSPVFQEGIKPIMFKALIGKGHDEFATMRQQDAEEFFTHLMKVLRQQAEKTGRDSTTEPMVVFKFDVEQRLQCTRCNGVRYHVVEQDNLSVPVPAREVDGKMFARVALTECLEIVTGVEELEYRCPRCSKDVVARRRMRFATFPNVLVIHAKKFQLDNWGPIQLDIPLELPADVLVLDQYLGTGLQENEEVLPDDAGDAALSPQLDEAALNQLQTMGFPLILCQKALLATGNYDAIMAMEWLFMHMDDPDIDTPVQTQSVSGREPSADQINVLVDMGFPSARARKALKEKNNSNAERAVEWLISHPGESDNSVSQSNALGGSASLPARYLLKAFISHEGPSVHCGHYVAHIRGENGEWILFNDEKVLKANAGSIEELKRHACLYFFEKST